MDYLLKEQDTKGDPEFTVAVTPAGSLPDYYPTEESDYALIPERIMWRILGVAKAYNLHFAEHVSPDGIDRWVYKGTQLQSLEDDLEFIFELINDDYLKMNINLIQSMLKKVSSKPDLLELAFEGP